MLSKKKWSSIDKYKLLLFFQAKVPLKLAGDFFDSNEGTINKAYDRYGMRRKFQRGDIKRRSYKEFKRLEDLHDLLSEFGLDREGIEKDSGHFILSPQIEWHPGPDICKRFSRAGFICSATWGGKSHVQSKKYQKIDFDHEGNARKRIDAHRHVFWVSKQDLLKYLEDLRIPVVKHSDAEVTVQGKRQTFSELLIRVNKQRLCKGLSTLNVEDVTY